MNPVIGSRGHDPPADEPGDDRHPGEGDRRQRRGVGVGAILDELDELLDRPDLGAEDEHVARPSRATKKRLRTASSKRTPVAAATGSVGLTRSPSGSQPSALGSGRTSHSAIGTMPTTQTSAEDRRRRLQPLAVDQPLGERA